MTVSSYIEGLVSKFKDERIVRNVTSLLHNMIAHKTIRVWSMSKDRAEFERSKRLIDGSLQSVLDEAKTAAALRAVGSEQVQVKLDTCGKSEPGALLVVLHDPCDIRKEYSAELENLGTVRSLDGTLIPGYLTFNTVVMVERGTTPQPLDMSVYRNGDAHYVTDAELKQFRQAHVTQAEHEHEHERQAQIQQFLDEDSYVNLKRVVSQHVTRVHQQMQAQFPEMPQCHV